MEFVTRERREYYKKRDRALLQPEQFCSIIVDGADQSAFGLPQFVTKTKDERGRSLKVCTIGVLEHKRHNQLHIFTMTEDQETGANHIVESVHRFLTTRVTTEPLPSKLFLQVDNCGRENKNRFFFAYMDCLIAWHVLKPIEVGFLPVVHTH